MLLIKTYLDRSAIHGLGVSPANSSARARRFGVSSRASIVPISRTNSPSCRSRRATTSSLRLSRQRRNHFDRGPRPPHQPLDKFNTCCNGHIVARHNIPKGAEITNDYRHLDTGVLRGVSRRKSRSPRQLRPRDHPAGERRRNTGCGRECDRQIVERTHREKSKGLRLDRVRRPAGLVGGLAPLPAQGARPACSSACGCARRRRRRSRPCGNAGRCARMRATDSDGQRRQSRRAVGH